MAFSFPEPLFPHQQHRYDVPDLTAVVVRIKETMRVRHLAQRLAQSRHSLNALPSSIRAMSPSSLYLPWSLAQGAAS